MRRYAKCIAALVAAALLFLMGTQSPSHWLALLLMTVGVAAGAIVLAWVVDPFGDGDDFISSTNDNLIHHTTEVCHRR